MTTKLITVEYLMTSGRNTPCQEEIKKFTKLFGKKGVRATKANIKRARKAGLNLEWLIVSWLPIEAADKYSADRKTIDDKYSADRKTIADKYSADRKPIEIEIVYQYLNA